MPAPDGLAAFQASQHYLLIDLHKLDPVVLAKKRSVLALLFRLELSTGVVVELEVLSSLATWPQGREQASLVLRNVLQKVLASRFDALPPGIADRIAQAPLAQLQLWLERAIDADTVDAVFAAPPASDRPT